MENRTNSSPEQKRNINKPTFLDGGDQTKKRKGDRRAKYRRISTVQDRRRSMEGYKSQNIDKDRRNPLIMDRRRVNVFDRRDVESDRRILKDRFRLVKEFLITGGYIGYIRYMPGTIASAAVTVIYGILLWTAPFIVVQLLHIFGIIFAIGMGYGLAGYAMNVLFRTQDPQQVVLDEIAGMGVSLIPFIYLNPSGMSPVRLFIYLLGTFGLFRVLDIFKPGLIGQMDRGYESHYVMNDDIVAGVITALIMHLVINLTV